MAESREKKRPGAEVEGVADESRAGDASETSDPGASAADVEAAIVDPADLDPLGAPVRIYNKETHRIHVVDAKTSAYMSDTTRFERLSPAVAAQIMDSRIEPEELEALKKKTAKANK